MSKLSIEHLSGGGARVTHACIGREDPTEIPNVVDIKYSIEGLRLIATVSFTVEVCGALGSVDE